MPMQCPNLRKGAANGNLPRIQESDTVTDSLHIGKDMGRKQDGGGAADLAEDVQDFFSSYRVKRTGGLVA